MKPSKRLHVTTRDEWRTWLAEHHDRENEVWLVYAKRHTGRPRIPYEHAVEEALCFGWIDSIVRRIDAGTYAQKFTPRRHDSNWSELNRDRFEALVRQGKMTEAGLAKAPPRRTAAARNQARAKRFAPLVVPAYIESGLKKNRRAWQNFENLAPSHGRMYVRWIDSAKRDETKQRRLKEAVARLKENKTLGLK